jgi:hypothetical protein
MKFLTVGVISGLVTAMASMEFAFMCATVFAGIFANMVLE